MQYFFSPYLPADQNLAQQYQELVVKYADIDKYLYIGALQKILFSLQDQEQKEFIMALENSEELAQKWLKNHPETADLLVEHLQRSILATKAQFL
ncbi:MAG: hypothetical protein QG639_549 [Patescibacteria group bacterium]|jgi:LPS O-antigen subunit length determinant protein (WzzB/FepE family)|nr:hypothetical protein [Patescibacteria group bacterium]